MTAIGAHRALVRFALSLAHAFAWLGIFASFLVSSGSGPQALRSVALTYALTQILVVLLTPLFARNVRHGMRRALFIATLGGGIAFAVLGIGYLSNDSAFLPWSISVFAVLMGIYRAAYFVPYNLMQRSQRIAFFEILIALAPALGGILIGTGWHMPGALYFAAGTIILVAPLPLLRVQERHEGFAWGYRRTFHELFAAGYKKTLLRTVLAGFEGATLLFLWPLAVWLILGQSVPLVGVLLSITLLVTLAIRALLSRFRLAPTPLVAATVTLSAWILRTVAGNGAAIVAIDTYMNAPAMRGVDTAAHEQAADNHTYVDEFTALKEIGSAIGRLILALTVALFVTNPVWPTFVACFILAGLAGGYVAYTQR